MNELTIPAFPNLPVDQTLYVWLARGELVSCDEDNRIARGAGALKGISESWRDWGKTTRVVVSGPNVRAKMKEGGRLTSTVLALEALPASSFLVDVGQALGRKFPDYATYTANQWVTSLSITPRSKVEVLAHMVEVAGRGTWSLAQRDLVATMVKEERYLVGSLDPFKQFSSVSYLADVWGAMLRSDPVGRNYFRSDGTIFDVVITNNVGGVYTARCDQAMKLKAGKRVVCLEDGAGFPGNANTQLRIISVTVEGGVYVLKVSRVGAGATLKIGQKVSLMETPFLSKAWVKKSKWADRVPAPPPPRPLPPTLAAELM